MRNAVKVALQEGRLAARGCFEARCPQRWREPPRVTRWPEVERRDTLGARAR